MIENQRVNTIGSNQSQEGLQSASSRNQNRNSHKSLTLRMLEKLGLHVSTVIRYAVCIFIGLLLANRVHSQNFNQLSNSIVASNDILLDKGLRGIFPPLSGSLNSLYGRWNQMLTTSVQNSTSKYNNYILNIKQNGDIELTHKKCKGDIKLQWHVFYYNICIKDKEKTEVKEKQNQMEIPNQKEDIECLMENGQFMDILKNSSIWSIHMSSLYIISEASSASTASSARANTKMLIFQKID